MFRWQPYLRIAKRGDNGRTLCPNSSSGIVGDCTSCGRGSAASSVTPATRSSSSQSLEAAFKRSLSCATRRPLDGTKSNSARALLC